MSQPDIAIIVTREAHGPRVKADCRCSDIHPYQLGQLIGEAIRAGKRLADRTIEQFKNAQMPEHAHAFMAGLYEAIEGEEPPAMIADTTRLEVPPLPDAEGKDWPNG